MIARFSRPRMLAAKKFGSRNSERSSSGAAACRSTRMKTAKGADGGRQHRPQPRRRPAATVGLGQPQHQGGQPHTGGQQAGHVEPARQSAARRRRQRSQRAGQQQPAQRDVEQEDRPPPQRLREQRADERAGCQRACRDPGPDAECEAPAGAGEGRHHHRQRGRTDERGAGPLGATHDQQHCTVGRQTGADRHQAERHQPPHSTRRAPRRSASMPPHSVSTANASV